MQAPSDRQVCTELRTLVDATDASDGDKDQMHELVSVLQARLRDTAGSSLPRSSAVAQVGRPPALGQQTVSKLRFQAAPVQPSISSDDILKLLALRLNPCTWIKKAILGYRRGVRKAYRCRN